MRVAAVRRWFFRIVLSVASLLLAGWIVLQTPWGRARVRDFVVRQIAGAVDGELTAVRLEGSLWSSASLSGVRISQGGVVVLAAERVSADYRLRGLLAGDITLSRLTVDGLTMTVLEGPNGWGVKGVVRSERAESTDAGPTFSFSNIHLTRGQVAVIPVSGSRREIADVALDADVTMADGRIQITARRFAGHEVTGGLVIGQMAGRLDLRNESVSVDDLVFETPASRLTGRAKFSTGTTPVTTEGHLVSEPGVSLPEFAPYLGAIGSRTLKPSFDLAWQGPLSALHVQGSVRSAAGDLTTDVVAGFIDTITVAGTARVSRLDLAPIVADPERRSRFTGEGAFNVRLVESAPMGLMGTFEVRLSEAQISGYAASALKAKGRFDTTGVSADVDGAAYGAATQAVVRWTSALEEFTAEGRVQQLDVRLLPATLDFYPTLETQLNGAYRLTKVRRDWSLSGTLDDSVVEGATFSSGTTVELQSQASDLTYHAVGRVANLDTQRLVPPLELSSIWLRDTPLHVSAVFDVSGTGRTQLKTHDMTFAFHELKANADGALMEGMSGHGTLVFGRLSLTAEGAVSGTWDRLLLVPGTDLQPVGHIVTDFVVDDMTALEIPFESITGQGRMTLTASRLLGLDVEHAVVNARWTAGTVTFTEGRASAHGIDATAEGDLAVSGSGASRLNFVMDAADLKPARELAGAEVEGAARAEGTITGPATAPEIAGTARGTQLVYQGVRMLGLSSTFRLVVPEWDFARLRGDVGADAMFLEVGGQTLQRAVATAVVDGHQADVAAVLEQPDRRLTANARVMVTADGREVSVTRADLASAGESWQLAPGAEARIRQAGGVVTLEDLRLVNGTQRLGIAGALAMDQSGPPTAGLLVRADEVAVGGMLKILVGEDRVRGQLDGDVRITGSVAEPQVASQFAITEGTADGVAFRSFGGKADYRAGGATLDVRLDAGDAGQLSAVGTVPVVVLDGQAATPLRVQVVGTLPNAAVLGPALPWVVDLTGSANIDLTLTGTLEQPRATGTAGLLDVAFGVPQLGSTYMGMNAAVHFDETLMVVDRFVVLDDDGHQLRIEGSLDVLAGGPSRALNLRARTTGFHLFSNDYGELVVSADLTAGGDLVAPNVLGTIRVDKGLVEVDRLLREFVLARGYVPAGSVESPVPAPTAPVAPPAPKVFTGSAISIDLVLPDNVVVRGRGIQTEEGIIGLGDVNLTLGGRLSIRKAPGAETSLLGEVSAVRGYYDFQGRRFSISRGSVLRFRGDDMTNPTLDITAEREISGVAVTARIRGTAAEPSLTLSSQPSLDQGDILALVAFGRPISQLGDEQLVSLAARATTIAAGALATPITDSVARALDLDVFEIQSGIGTTGGTSVLLGRQISDRLFVGLRHQFGNAGTQQLSFEYRLTEYLRLVSTISPGAQPSSLSAGTEAAGIDLIFVIRR